MHLAEYGRGKDTFTVYVSYNPIFPSGPVTSDHEVSLLIVPKTSVVWLSLPGETTHPSHAWLQTSSLSKLFSFLICCEDAASWYAPPLAV